MSKSEKKVLKSMAENNEKKGVDLSSLTELDFSPNCDNKKNKSEKRTGIFHKPDQLIIILIIMS